MREQTCHPLWRLYGFWSFLQTVLIRNQTRHPLWTRYRLGSYFDSPSWGIKPAIPADHRIEQDPIAYFHEGSNLPPPLTSILILIFPSGCLDKESKPPLPLTNIYIYIYKLNTHTYIYIYTNKYIYIYIYMIIHVYLSLPMGILSSACLRRDKARLLLTNIPVGIFS